MKKVRMAFMVKSVVGHKQLKRRHQMKISFELDIVAVPGAPSLQGCLNARVSSGLDDRSRVITLSAYHGKCWSVMNVLATSRLRVIIEILNETG
jgi:hypothetical protein